MKLAVAIACYNEEKYIEKTLKSLAAQTDSDFKIFLCDNASTDGSAAIAKRAAQELGLELVVVPESQKGTGAAADTACRAAFSAGYDVIARTDADAIVDKNWVSTVRKYFESHPNALIGGITSPITAEVTRARRNLIMSVTMIAIFFGIFRPSNYGGGKRGLYLMTQGNNLAIDKETYFRAGGFRRVKIEEMHEDRALVNDVRATGGRVRMIANMRVQVSVRRVSAWGLRNTLKWYANHSYRGENVDVR